MANNNGDWNIIHNNISHGLRTRARMHFLDTFRVKGMWHATTSTSNWLIDNGVDPSIAKMYSKMLKAGMTLWFK